MAMNQFKHFLKKVLKDNQLGLNLHKKQNSAYLLESSAVKNLITCTIKLNHFTNSLQPVKTPFISLCWMIKAWWKKLVQARMSKLCNIQTQ
jgi:hypothetical protein